MSHISSFVTVASQLILIKSRAILPRPPVVAIPVEEGPDPEAALRERLILYRLYRDAGRDLKGRLESGWEVFRREPIAAVASAKAGSRPDEGPPLDPAAWSRRSIAPCTRYRRRPRRRLSYPASSPSTNAPASSARPSSTRPSSCYRTCSTTSATASWSRSRSWPCSSWSRAASSASSRNRPSAPSSAAPGIASHERPRGGPGRARARTKTEEPVRQAATSRSHPRGSRLRPTTTPTPTTRCLGRRPRGAAVRGRAAAVTRRAAHRGQA